jgi:hypothetical protein
LFFGGGGVYFPSPSKGKARYRNAGVGKRSTKKLKLSRGFVLWRENILAGRLLLFWREKEKGFDGKTPPFGRDGSYVLSSQNKAHKAKYGASLACLMAGWCRVKLFLKTYMIIDCCFRECKLCDQFQ